MLLDVEREQATHNTESAETLSFGQWFRLRRDALGMTQKDLALKAGCAIATVRAIEQESMRPSSGMASALGQQLRAPEETEQFVSLFMNVARGLADISVLPPPNPLISAKRPQSQVRPPCPYLGIQAFSMKDKERFFGRQDEVRDLRSKLAHHRLLFVIGPSGSGKSSLIQAGLIPALSESAQFPKGTWTHLTIRPGAAPLEELSHQLGGSLETLDLTLDVRMRSEREPCLLVLIVDPFEDVFTQAPASAPGFFRTLTQIATHPNCYVILVTRADFFGELMAPPYWAIAQQQRVELAPLRGEHLRSAIVEPAQAAQVTIESALVDRLISDADDAPGVLPLVQETLVRLWDEIRDMTITLNAYKALGKTAGSPVYLVLADRADMSMADKNLTEADRRVAWRVLLRLVQFGEGRTNTRRQQPISALRSADDDDTMLKRVITHLAADRLLTLGKNYANVAVVDVSHEALLTHWPSLTARLDRDRAAELTRRTFDALAAQWQMQVEQGGPSRLLQSAELQEIEDWLASDESGRVGYSAALMEWAAQSSAAATQEKQQQYAVLDRLQVQERALRFSRRILSVLLVFLALVGIFFLGRIGYFEWLRRQADWDAQMVEIHAGPAVIGFAIGIDTPQTLGSYRLDRYEVANRHYRTCVDAGACSEPLRQYGQARYRNPQFDNRPIVDITAFQAAQFCAWRGRRLPTETEWERAVRGTAGRRAPWITQPISGTVQFGIDGYFLDDTADVNALPMSATPQSEGAIYHLYGNVAEFVMKGGSDPQYFVVGLSYMQGIANDFTEVKSLDPEVGRPYWGFRCAAAS